MPFPQHRSVASRGRAAARIPRPARSRVRAAVVAFAAVAAASSLAGIAPAARAVPTPSAAVTPLLSATVTSSYSHAQVGWTYGGGLTAASLTHVVVAVSEGGRPVTSEVTRPQDTFSTIVGLTPGHSYDLRVTALDEGAVVATATAVYTPDPSIDRIELGSAVLGAGAVVPFTILVEAPSAQDTVVTVEGSGPGLEGAAVTVTLPAGSRTVTGALPVSSDVWASTEPLRVFAEATLGDGKRPQHAAGDDATLIPASTAPAVRATVTVPDSVAEPASGATGTIPVTVTLDRPSPDVSIYYYAPRTADDGFGWLRVPKGETTATFRIPFEGDDTPSGRSHAAFWFSPPDGVVVDDPIRIVEVVDSLPDAPAPRVGLPFGSARVGMTQAGAVTVMNVGNVTATGAQLVGEIGKTSPLLRVTSGSGPCTVTAKGTGVTFACPLDPLPPGVIASVWVEMVPTVPTDGAAVVARVQGEQFPASTRSLRWTVEGKACTITGTFGDDTLTGTAGDDVICGPLAEGARDVVVPGAGNDLIVSAGLVDYSGAPRGLKMGTGAYTTVRGWGTDKLDFPAYAVPDGAFATLRATGFADQLYFDGNLSLEAGPGDDTVTANGWRLGHGQLGWVIDGGAGIDTLAVKTVKRNPIAFDLGSSHFRGVEKVKTGAGSQTITGSGGADHVSSGADGDRLRMSDGIGGNDVVDAGPGDDTCTADVGDEVSGCEHLTWVPVS